MTEGLESIVILLGYESMLCFLAVVRTELPLGSYSKYSWHITSLLQVKQIFDTPEVNSRTFSTGVFNKSIQICQTSIYYH